MPEILEQFGWRTWMFALLAVAALGVSFVAAPDAERYLSGEEEYRELDELPRIADSHEDIEPTAIALAEALDEPPVSGETQEACPSDRLVVSWDAPQGDYQYGTYIEPVGPEPTEDTGVVNGVVLCEGSDYGFMGFEAFRRDDDRFELAMVPTHEAQEHDGEHPHEQLDDHEFEFEWPDFPAFEMPRLPEAPDLSLGDLGPIDDYATYEPQRICHPEAKPGTIALAHILLEAYEGTRNFGISRPCDIGGRSEHKEGRAFDWGVDVSDLQERAAAENFLELLLATDDEGNDHALARRMGVMYIIWDGQIWSADRPDEGWRPYRHPSGESNPTLAHEDHVHISLSWEGAMGRTSLWEALLPEEGLIAGLPSVGGGSGGIGGVQPRAVSDWSEGELAEERRSRTATEPVSGATTTGGTTTTTSDDGGDDDDDDLTRTVQDSTDRVTRTVEDTADDTTDTVDDTVDEVEDTVDETVDDAEETIRDTLN